MSENRFVGKADDLEISQCVDCIYWRQGACVAFPKEIPMDILTNEFIHDKKHSKQTGPVIFKRKK